MNKIRHFPDEFGEKIRVRKSWWGKDIVLNVGLKEDFLRLIIALLLPFLLMVLPAFYIWIIVIPSVYLFTTGLTHFCILKYCWLQLVLRHPIPDICDLSKELDMPVEEL